MIEGIFKHEDDLLKHHVRKKGWLPLCKKRLNYIRATSNPKTARRLRYFTFCAVGAVDVLMLDVERVIRRSTDGRFDTVTFFDKNPELVHETQKRIPGANGFPGDFTKVVLLDDPDEENVVDATEPLSPREDSPDLSDIRSNQLILSQRKSFINLFPFDVINLDLEEFLFKPNDPRPGRVINALRKVFQWQKRPFKIRPGGPEQHVNEFSLMFTTQIGPTNLSEEYLDGLRNLLSQNLQEDSNLITALMDRTGINDVRVLQENDFDNFFKLSMPKTLASTLMEEDWHVNPKSGIIIFEYERPSESGPYKMLHLIMDIKRNDPQRERRLPGSQPLDAQEAYREVVRQIFSRKETLITMETINPVELQTHLNQIKAQRRLYYPDEEA